MLATGDRQEPGFESNQFLAFDFENVEDEIEMESNCRVSSFLAPARTPGVEAKSYGRERRRCWPRADIL